MFTLLLYIVTTFFTISLFYVENLLWLYLFNIFFNAELKFRRLFQKSNRYELHLTLEYILKYKRNEIYVTFTMVFFV